MKELFKQKNREYKQKQKTIYFKGTPTTKKIHKIREILETYAKTRNNMIIKLDAWHNYRPVTDTAGYLFLLNLPGHYSWSNRFKYLFLSNSIIININALTKGINEEGWNEDYYNSFIDLIMVKDVDYIEMEFTYFNSGYSKSEALKAKAQKMTNAEIDRIIKQINDVYDNYDANKSKYEKMINSYRGKINQLSNATLYHYILKCIIFNAEIVKG
jgi:hypothetical protein